LGHGSEPPGLTIRADPGFVGGSVFSSDGRWLAALCGDGAVQLWDAATGRPQPRRWQAWQPAIINPNITATLSNAVAFSPDGRHVAAAGGTWNHGQVHLWDVATGETVHTLEGHTLMVNCVAFSPDGRRLASGSNDGTVKLWDVATGEEVFTLRGHHSGVLSVAFSPDGYRLATGSIDLTAKVWDATPVDTGQKLPNEQP
jgi:WD40 repeat protein